MYQYSILSILCICFLAVTPLIAQQDTVSGELDKLQEQFKNSTQPGGASSAERAELVVKLSQNLVPAGGNFQAAVLLDIEDNWHVNAHQPTLDYLIGTKLKLQDHEHITLLETKYPEAEMVTFNFAEEVLAVYEGEVPIYLSFQTSDLLEPGNYELAGQLQLQACNDEVCLVPSNMEVSIPIEVTAEGTGAQAINQELFKNYEEGSGSVTDLLSAGESNEIAAMFDAQGYFWAFLGIFLIGLALNLTPCVYPMLSVTVSLFGGQGTEDRKLSRSFYMASVYVLGIIFMYSVLGVAAATTGSLFGSWMQNSWVLLAIGLLILALALSMFGLYELQVPPSLMQKLSGAQQATGTVGHFLSGLVVGVFAAPCIGPPIIALLAFVGSEGDPAFGFLTMFVLALDLGIPYLILGTFSGLLGTLPKSGTWMVWVKKVFGVVLVGVAFFYSALAFFPSYSIHTIPIVLLIGGIYLGFLESTTMGKKGFRYLKRSVGIASVIAGLLLVQNLMKPSIEWEDFSRDKLEEARAEGIPVMMDFYADWCVPCLELERVTYTDLNVIDVTRNYRKLKVDLTNYESEESEELRKEFKVAGVPTIVFLNGKGEEVRDARVVGFLRPEPFLGKIGQLE